MRLSQIGREPRIWRCRRGWRPGQRQLASPPTVRVQVGRLAHRQAAVPQRHDTCRAQAEQQARAGTRLARVQQAAAPAALAAAPQGAQRRAGEQAQGGGGGRGGAAGAAGGLGKVEEEALGDTGGSWGERAMVFRLGCSL